MRTRLEHGSSERVVVRVGAARSLEDAVAANAGMLRAPMTAITSELGSAVVGEVTVRQVAGTGLRGLPALVSDVSWVSPVDGLYLRGLPIREVVPRGVLATFWLAMTGEYPSEAELAALTGELAEHAAAGLSPPVLAALEALAADERVTPMDLLVAGFTGLGAASEYRAVRTSSQRDGLVRAAVRDAVRIMAVAPLLAATIYGLRYRGGPVGAPDWSRGWGGHLSGLLGMAHPLAPALLDRFCVVHADQGKGNFSCHAAHLVASTGADPYLAVCAATAALAGPAHAVASQDVLELFDRIRSYWGVRPSYEQVEEFMVRWARSGRRLPGHGQAIMRNVDTRFLELYDFGERHFAGSAGFAMVGHVWRAMPKVFHALGRSVSSPHPNVNLVSGSLLAEVGIAERDFIPVLFATSRLIGVLAQFVEDRIWAVAPERPDSLSTADLRDRVSAGVRR